MIKLILISVEIFQKPYTFDAVASKTNNIFEKNMKKIRGPPWMGGLKSSLGSSMGDSSRISTFRWSKTKNIQKFMRQGKMNPHRYAS